MNDMLAEIKPLFMGMLDLLGDREVQDKMANISMGMFLALRRAGFTDDQAIQIVVAQAQSLSKGGK